ncbi:MAG TPA: hypothetical protein VH351_13920 [Bryobacteraceae bacterium]|jgi:hypothetical protein|nr:hypothetical protein [Bryobacteraceae bacterium]
MRSRSRYLIGFAFAVVLVSLFWWRFRPRATVKTTKAAATTASDQSSAPPANTPTNTSETRIHAHNLLLRKGPSFRIYVTWLDGDLARTHRNVNPSLDDSNSFYLDVHSGMVRANIGDLGNYLNTVLTDTPLQHISLLADSDQLKMTGTLKKIVPLPIELVGQVSTTSDNRIRLHVTKLDVLKIPLKGLLGFVKISLADFFKQDIQGVEINGNDLLFDTQKLMPAPRIRGQLTKVRVVSPDIEEVYGGAVDDAQRVELWRNYLSLKGGALNFGKLTMNDVDLMMIDISKDPWFDLDLVNYRTQLSSGYTRMTAQMGLQIFMPDLREVQPAKPEQNTNIEWFKNRNIPPPPQITTNIH